MALIAVPYLAWKVHGVVRDRDHLLADFQALGPERIRAIQFKSQQSYIEGPDCFWIRSPDQIAAIARKLVQAEPLSQGGQVTPALGFAMIIHFTDEGSEKFLGDVYRQEPMHVFLNRSYWTEGHFGKGGGQGLAIFPFEFPDGHLGFIGSSRKTTALESWVDQSDAKGALGALDQMAAPSAGDAAVDAPLGTLQEFLERLLPPSLDLFHRFEILGTRVPDRPILPKQGLVAVPIRTVVKTILLKCCVEVAPKRMRSLQVGGKSDDLGICVDRLPAQLTGRFFPLLRQQSQTRVGSGRHLHKSFETSILDGVGLPQFPSAGIAAWSSSSARFRAGRSLRRAQ